MKIEGVELVRVDMPLVRPFETSFGVQHARRVLLVRVTTSEGDGWGECTAGDVPNYSSEYADGAEVVMERFLLPPLLDMADVAPTSLAHAWRNVRGHLMAKAAVESALLDAWLRARGVSMAEYLGGTRSHVMAGVSIGIPGSVEELLDIVGEHIDDGYCRIKLKIKHGWDVVPVQAVRERFGESLDLQVDANCAYRAADVHHLVGLDAFDLTLVEQPFPADDLESHATLRSVSRTPVCLDESVESASDTVRALRAGACDIVNIKPGRVGGFLEARRIHDIAAASGVPVWCGGMLETGVGRAGNVALASLPGFTLPGDTSASSRYWKTDITEPFVLRDGGLDVPTGPGTGVEVREDLLRELGATRRLLT